MLKITILFTKPIFNGNNSSNSTFKEKNNNNKVDQFNINNDGLKHTKKSEKLKSKKLSNSQNLAKLGKKLL